MEAYFNKKLALSLFAMILVLFQSNSGRILIDIGLIFTSLAIANMSKNKESKFDFYSWSFLFVIFIAVFIIKTIILV